MSDQGERMRKGQQAEYELPLTRNALRAIRQHLLEAIAATAFEDQSGRERLYLSVQLLEPVEHMLISFITDGAIARSEIDTAEHLKAAAEGRQVN